MILNKKKLNPSGIMIVIFFLPTIGFCLTWPIPIGFPGRESITGTHGEFRSETRTHVGVDIGVVNQPVIASASGTVESGWREDRGWYVIINNYYKYYHLANDSYLAPNKSIVNEGDRIGTSSNTGAAGTYHLHFGMGDENPLLYFDIPDTNNGVIGEVYFKSVDKLLVLKDGMIFNKSNPFPVSGEFVVNAYDISNTGSNHVNFYKIVSILDNKVLKEWEFNVSHTDEASLIYSISNPTSTISNFYYRMGEWL
jgi:murein DD-endopeptidase MepM/ murein hydrolase activator NlpD